MAGILSRPVGAVESDEEEGDHGEDQPAGLDGLAALMIAVGRESDARTALGRALTEMPAAQYRRLLLEDPVLLDVKNDPRFLALAQP